LALTYLQCPSPKHMEQELLALLGHIRSSQIFDGVRVVQAFSFLCNVLSIIICHFVLVLFAIKLSFLLRFTDSD
jgi:hypothetical protein